MGIDGLIGPKGGKPWQFLDQIPQPVHGLAAHPLKAKVIAGFAVFQKFLIALHIIGK